MSAVTVFLPKLLLIIAAFTVGIWLLVKILVGLGWVVGSVFNGVASILGRIGEFVAHTGSDVLRFAGGLITAVIFVPLTVGNIAIGRWSAANHYGKALEREAVGAASSLYRLVLGNPARLLGLTSLTDGIERRIPEAMARAPGPDTPGGRSDAFDGYTVVGSLPAGGSGARLYLAEPDADKQALFGARGVPGPHRVVIKSFSLSEGSTMPQIVRESRALEAARKLGLVLEHELAGTRFHYVMPYVPGEDLNVVTQRLHAESGGDGLAARQLDRTLGFTADLLQVLHRFHQAGLWHKDIKPSNILVSEGRVHVVDLGLITPLSSAMTLTTHGTEYFRDPELVRLALRGVKVNEVDGVKFDIYAAGAVLYSMIENSFPAHGSLSKVTRRCPEALTWIIRRAMADIDNRYASAVEMLADVRAVIAARDAYAVKPAGLPSFRGDPSVAQRLASDLAHAGSGPLPPAAQAAAAPTPPSPDPVQGTLPASGRRGRVGAGTAAAGMLAASLLGFLMVAGIWQVRSGGGLTSVAVPDPSSPRPAARTVTHGRQHLPPRDWAARRPQPSRLLVVDQIPAKLAISQEQHIEAKLDMLEEARFEVLTRDRHGALDEDQVIQLLAEVRTVIGTNPHPDGSVLAEFLKQEGRDLDAVLWLGPGDDPDEVAYQVVGELEDRQDVQLVMQPSRISDSRPGAVEYTVR